MTISKVNPPGWGIGDKLTVAQANAFDTKIITAVDNTSAGDTINGPITFAGAGRLVITTAAGVDADTTYQPNVAGHEVRVTSAVTANRTYSLGSTGAVNGDVITVQCNTAFAFEIAVQDLGAPGTTLFTIGNLAGSDGQWATFEWTGAVWIVLHGGQGSRLKATFPATSTSVTAPRGVSFAMLIGYGGGGGGGGAQAGSTTAGTVNGGGGGGGGAVASTVIVPVTPLSSYAVVLGAGGVSGAANTPGGSGGDTTFGTLATFPGAQGGSPGFPSVGGAGGQVVRGSATIGAVDAVGPGEGGYGGTHSASGAGGRLGYVFSTSVAASTNGGIGTDSGGFFGGGGGGGGGVSSNSDVVAGSAGNGAAGGNGALAGSGATGGTGSTGTFGCGGGGGGAGGNGAAVGGIAGVGGAGGAGRLCVIWVK